MKIGYIGLGNMGGGMAASILKAGYSLTVHDLTQKIVKPFLEEGAFWADTPKTLAETSDIVFTSLPGPPEVESVVLGKDGIVEGIRSNAIYIDTSTSSPTLARHIYHIFKEKGASMMDAPVSGGPTGARSGKLQIMASGDEEAFHQCKSVLDAMGDRVNYMGKIGSGTICKLMHNCIIYGMQTIIAECLTAGVKAGVEPKALWQAIIDGAVGRASFLRSTLPETYLQRHFDPPNFALRLAFKDIGLATSLGREFDVPMEVANLVFQELMTAMNRGWGDQDSRIAMLLQEERAGEIEVSIPNLESK